MKISIKNRQLKLLINYDVLLMLIMEISWTEEKKKIDMVHPSLIKYIKWV